MTRRGFRAAHLLATFVAVAAAPSVAHAEGSYLLPGFIFGPVFGTPSAFATGAELSFMHYHDVDSSVGWGAFAQVEHYGGSDAGFGRWALGAQAGKIVGVELGVDHRDANGPWAGTTGLHVAPYLSAGLVTVAFRVSVPMASSGAGAAYGTEEALVFGLKIPIPFGKPPPDFGPGRVLAVAGEARLAPLVSDASWS